MPAYQAMLGKAEQIIELPETKEHQNRNISTQFFSCFDEIMVKKMEAVWFPDILERKSAMKIVGN